MSPTKLQQQSPQFWSHRFPWTRDRIMSKLLRVSSPSDLRKSKGLNNNILLVIITFNNYSHPVATGRTFTTCGSSPVRACSPTLWGEFSFSKRSLFNPHPAIPPYYMRTPHSGSRSAVLMPSLQFCSVVTVVVEGSWKLEPINSPIMTSTQFLHTSAKQFSCIFLACLNSLKNLINILKIRM